MPVISSRSWDMLHPGRLKKMAKHLNGVLNQIPEHIQISAHTIYNSRRLA